jgi:hypothetical protein
LPSVKISLQLKILELNCVLHLWLGTSRRLPI